MKRIFIDGLSGMAQGLFATLIIGTIIQQIGLFVGGDYGNLIYMIGKVAAGLTGAGIGVGVARKLEAQQLVTVSAAVAGMIGAFASKLLAGQLMAIWCWQGRESRWERSLLLILQLKLEF